MNTNSIKKTKGIKTKTLKAKLKADSGGFKFKKPVDDIDKAIQAFLSGETSGQFGKYAIHNDMLLFKAVVTERTSIAGHRYGLELADRRAASIKSIKELLGRAADLQIDLVSHTADRLTEILASLEQSETEYYGGTVSYKEVKANLIARRIGKHYIGNSSILSLIGRTVSFGNERLNRNETDIQQRLSRLIPMIPFSVFAEANLDLTEYKLIERGDAETVRRKYTKEVKVKGEYVEQEYFENVHFTGASLFEVSGRYFLFDIDRREIELGIFNPFLAELPRPVNTIEQAYHSLKPLDVLKAEQAGLEVLRQGEWFFIPVQVDAEFKADLNPNYNASREQSRWNTEFMRAELRAGENRPNEVSLYNAETGYVSGLVEHTGREHAPLKLKGWYRPIPNTATRSFTITGDID